MNHCHIDDSSRIFKAKFSFLFIEHNNSKEKEKQTSNQLHFHLIEIILSCDIENCTRSDTL